MHTQTVQQISTAQCGQCVNYKSARLFPNGTTTWGYCAVLAVADLPANKKPSDKYAASCEFYSPDVPF